MEGCEDSDSEGASEQVLDAKPIVGDIAEAEETSATSAKKTKGRVKIKMEFIDNKLRRYTTFSKRKTGIMKKAYELSTLTGTQVMLLVASETGHVYTFATKKLQPMITSEEGKSLIQTCLNSPDPPNSSSGQQSDQRMSATGFEEPDLTYTLPTANSSTSGSQHQPPPPQNTGETPSQTPPVDVKMVASSPNQSPPDDRHRAFHEGASFYNQERERDISPHYDTRRARQRSSPELPRSHFYQETVRPRSPYRSDSPKYHTITPRASDHRRAPDRDNNGRERSRSVSPQQYHRKYVGSIIGESSSRHSSGHRQKSPSPHQPRHTSSPQPSLHHHHYLPLAHSSASSASHHAVAPGARSRSRSPASPSLSEGEVAASTSAGGTLRLPPPDGRPRKPPSPVMTTVNTHNKIMNASYHPKLVRGGPGGSSVDGGGKSSSANFISTQALAMQLPNGTLISPGSLPPGLALAPLPPRGHTYVKLASGQQFVPISAPNSSPRSHSPTRSPSHHAVTEKDTTHATRRGSRADGRDQATRDHSPSPVWEGQERNDARLSERPSDTPPPSSLVPPGPGFVLSSNFLVPVAQLPVSSAGSKPTALMYPPSLSSSEASSSQSIPHHIPDGAQYILNIPGLQNPAVSSDVGAPSADAGVGPHFIAFQVPVAAQQTPKKTAKAEVGRYYAQQ